MPLPVITSHNATCAYQECETEGHTVCRTLADYYQRLCDAAALVVVNPTEDNIAALRVILEDDTKVHHDR